MATTAIQYTHNGAKITDNEMANAVQRFAINGYDDVPASNLYRIAKMNANVHAAIPRAPSENTGIMLNYLADNNYDWMCVTVEEYRRFQPETEQNEECSDDTMDSTIVRLESSLVIAQ